MDIWMIMNDDINDKWVINDWWINQWIYWSMNDE